MTTEMPATLAEALCRLQADPPAIVKAETANTNTYSYRFAGLAAVTAVVLPRLAELGCAWICRPTVGEGGRPVLAYALRHVASGEEVAGEYPLSLPPGATPQQQGSMISYARRYALLAVTGVAPEADDDDGAAASKPTRARRPSTKDDEPATDPERRKKRLFALYGEEGPPERDARLADLSEILGRPIASSNDLTPDDIETAIGVLEKRQRARRRQAAAADRQEANTDA